MGAGDSPNWYLERVEVCDTTTGRTVTFPCMNWIGLDSTPEGVRPMGRGTREREGVRKRKEGERKGKEGERGWREGGGGGRICGLDSTLEQVRVEDVGRGGGLKGVEGM